MRLRIRLFVVVVVAALQGCASTSVFSPYPNQAQAWKSSLEQGQPTAGISSLAKGASSQDRLLYLEEQARLEQLGGEYDASRSSFATVFGLYDSEDAQARIRASGLAAGTASLLTNDNALPYRGEAYERILGHAFQAFNYLALNDTEGAGVEVRAAALEQRVAEQQHDKQIARAEQDADENNIDTSGYSGYFQGVDTAAAGVRSSITNAWTYYFSAAFWEGTGNYNDALVDYKKALSINPGIDFIKADIERVSKKLDGRWRSDKGLVVILHEQGLVPPKREVSIPIPTVQGYFSIAFPTYDPADFTPPVPLHAQGETENVSTQVLVRISGAAAKALKDRIPGMLVRQTLRAKAKYEAQKQANDNLGLLGALTTQIYNLVSERADLRSWLTLPAYGLAARMELPAGTRVLKLSTQSGNASVEVPVRAGGVTLVRVVEAGAFLHTEVYPLKESQ